ncbi:hypothetical protein LNAOJCKE_5699 [Methylorubrum aminovorans]|uniref:Uncharacterized protein n=1 Tax=Methylorubrum aminovorans TaxID=269069 RepID=A0ABQ4UME4_9HYPH|nr:hypothetical protein [Methylorubrum aminovorans]GJE68455.1 hypothetical protein LNAOJCKE_5699 [Methylorubrum aminovorans]GMA74856.1 hypothetical protein GCM10025880_12730 [Methylorubrum aminovorans]
MTKLKPLYMYRLRILGAEPRCYAPSATNSYLERRNLIQQTGRRLPSHGYPEYEITDAGRRALRAASTSQK